MNLQTLLNSTSVPSVELSGLAEHTDDVKTGDAYLSVGGDPAAQEKYCLEALAKGACIVLYEASANCPGAFAVPTIPVSALAERKGQIAAHFYGNPSAQLTCVGVTGTNGKTSVAYHVADLFSSLGAGCGYSGTLGWGRLDGLQDSGLTTANSVLVQRQLAQFCEQGLSSAALEVSSHALDQGRVQDVEFDVGVFTNLSRDHLDYHGTLEAYGEAKRRLFTEWPLNTAVINTSDDFGKTLALQCDTDVVSYGDGADWSWQYALAPEHMEICWQTPHGQFEASMPVMAEYAIANLTAAMAVVMSQGHDAGKVFGLLSSLRGIPGRMETVDLQGSPNSPSVPTVIVDYAHTPDALAKVLSSLREVSKGKLICVVGCGGDRDKGKRPQMGAVSRELADQSWFTSDNPRGEDPAQIVLEMGGQQDDHVEVCIDRKEAIAASIFQAEPGDVVVIAGKGHEDYQEVDGQRLPFDDRQEAMAALRAYADSKGAIH